jgi:uncharacterized membrane protein
LGTSRVGLKKINEQFRCRTPSSNDPSIWLIGSPPFRSIYENGNSRDEELNHGRKIECLVCELGEHFFERHRLCIGGRVNSFELLSVPNSDVRFLLLPVNHMAKKAQSKKAVSEIGMAGGAAAGAAAGAVLGPVGAAIGALVGGVAGSRSGISLEGNTMENVKSKVVAPVKGAVKKVGRNIKNRKATAQKSISSKGSSTAKASRSKSKTTGVRKAKKTVAKK